MARRTRTVCFRSSGRFTAYDCRSDMLHDNTALAMLEVFRFRYQAFRNKFGRDPEPDEPLFFDPNQQRPVAPEASVIRHQVMTAASAARVDGTMVLDVMRMSRYPSVPGRSAEVHPCRRVPKDDE